MERFSSLREADEYIDDNELEAEAINAALGTGICLEDAKTLWWHFFTDAQRKYIIREWLKEKNRKEKTA